MLVGWIVTIFSDNGSSRVVDPVADDVVISQGNDDNQPYVYDATVDSDLLLVKEDFYWLRDLYFMGCQEVTINLEKGAFSHTAILDLRALKFDDGNCEVLLKLSSDSKFACLERKKSKKYDVLRDFNLVNRNLQLIAGELETSTCNFVDITEIPETVDELSPYCSPPDANAWTVVSWIVAGIIQNPSDPSDFEGNLVVTYARQRYNGPPLGGNWIDIGGGVSVAPPPIGEYIVSGSVETGVVRYETETYESDFIIDNGRSLNDVVAAIALQCGLRYQSVFFGEGAPAIADPLVYPPAVYDIAYEHFHKMLLFQKSDVKRSQSIQNATRALITWDQLVKVFDFFNTKVEIIGDIISVEHVSYFQSGMGTDLTQAPYEQYMRRKWYFQGQDENRADTKEFAFMDETDLAFDGVSITYDCGNAENPDGLALSNMTTNIVAMLDNPEGIDNQGFALVAPVELPGGNFVAMGVSNALIPSLSPLNGALSIPNIQDWFHRHGANFETGTLNESSVTFDSVLPQIETEAEILMTFDDFLAYKPGEQVTTPYGPLSVTNATYSFKTCTLTLDLEGNATV